MSGREWGIRVGAVALLVLVHIGVWRPAREALAESVAYPLAASIDTARARNIAVRLEPRVVRADVGDEVHRYPMPAALSYLVVATVLIAVWPQRLYWLWLWGAHLAMGLVAYAAFVSGIGWTGWGFAVATLVRNYLEPALGLGVLLWASRPMWRGELR